MSNDNILEKTLHNLANLPRLGRHHQYSPRKLEPWGFPPHLVTSSTNEFKTISIVTPAYYQSKYLAACIESVINQNYPFLDYFVQDGGSADGTVEVLEKYSHRISGWESRPDSGQSDAINKAFGKTRGEIMGWLNSDDLLLPGTLALVSDYFNKNPDVDVVYGHRIMIDEEGREIGRWILPPHMDWVLSWEDFIPQETLFWRRAIWEAAGSKIDENFQFAMDWDLLLRFRSLEAKMVRLPYFLGAFRVHKQQKTSAKIKAEGRDEMEKLRFRELGKDISYKKARIATFPYILLHVLFDAYYRIRQTMQSFFH